MTIKTCDICAEPIEKLSTQLYVNGQETFKHFDLCEICSLPIVKILKSSRLIKKDLLKQFTEAAGKTRVES